MRLVRLTLATVCMISGTFAAGTGPAGQPTPVSPPNEAVSPEQLTPHPVRSRHGMVVCNSPEAARAGVEMLEAGGNAVDAAVATAFALGVTEAGASGLGGQAAILIRLASGRSVAIDGNSFAPRQIPLESLAELHQKKQNWGAPTVAVPTAPAALAMALERYGTMPLERVLAPAIALAVHGAVMGETQRAFLGAYLENVSECDYLTATFLRFGVELFEPDRVYCQPALAATLRRLAEVGIQDLYRGQLADRIEQDMIAMGTGVRREDLARVRPTERIPALGRFRDLEVVAYPEPGGGDAVIGALEILDGFPRELVAGHTPDSVHVLVEAVRLALADHLLSAPQHRLPFPVAHRQRPRSRWVPKIRFDRCLLREEITDQTEEEFWSDSATTHLSVIDRDGTIVTATLTLGKNFGASTASPQLGIVWNSFLAGPGKTEYGTSGLPRPWRSIRTLAAPTILLKDGKPYLILGSQSSGRIIGSVVQVVVNVVDRGLQLPDALAHPRAVWHGLIDGRLYLEMAPPMTDDLANVMMERGFTNIYRLTFPARPIDLAAFGGVNAIMVDPETGEYVGVGDPRRFAAAMAPNPENMSGSEGSQPR